MIGERNKELLVMGIRNHGFSSILECKYNNGMRDIVVLVDPFVGCSVDVADDISMDDYVSIAEKMVGKKYLLSSDHIFEPMYLPNEGQFTEIKED